MKTEDSRVRCRLPTPSLGRRVDTISLLARRVGLALLYIRPKHPKAGGSLDVGFRVEDALGGIRQQCVGDAGRLVCWSRERKSFPSLKEGRNFGVADLNRKYCAIL